MFKLDLEKAAVPEIKLPTSTGLPKKQETAYSETKQRFMIGKADINSLTLSLNRQQEAQRNYILALQNYWLSYYKIRKLTLHDFETGVSLSNEFDYKNGL